MTRFGGVKEYGRKRFDIRTMHVENLETRRDIPGNARKKRVAALERMETTENDIFSNLAQAGNGKHRENKRKLAKVL